MGVIYGVIGPDGMSVLSPDGASTMTSVPALANTGATPGTPITINPDGSVQAFAAAGAGNIPRTLLPAGMGIPPATVAQLTTQFPQAATPQAAQQAAATSVSLGTNATAQSGVLAAQAANKPVPMSSFVAPSAPQPAAQPVAPTPTPAVQPTPIAQPAAQPVAAMQPMTAAPPSTVTTPQQPVSAPPATPTGTSVTPYQAPTVTAPTSNYGSTAADLTAIGLGAVAASPGGIGSFITTALGIPPITSQALLSAAGAGLGMAAGVDAANTAATILSGGTASAANTLAQAATNAGNIQSQAALTGANQLTAGDQAALATANQTLQQQQALNQPGVNLGQSSLAQLQTALSPGGSLTTPFNMVDTSAYKFARNQALQAGQNAAAAGGTQLSSGTVQNQQTTAANIAGQQEQQAFNQWLASNNLTLQSLQAGINSGQININAVNTALTNAGISTQTLQQNIGAAAAAGTVGSAAATAQGVTGAANASAAGQLGVAGAQATGVSTAGSILNQGLTNIGNALATGSTAPTAQQQKQVGGGGASGGGASGGGASGGAAPGLGTPGNPQPITNVQQPGGLTPGMGAPMNGTSYGQTLANLQQPVQQFALGNYGLNTTAGPAPNTSGVGGITGGAISTLGGLVSGGLTPGIGAPMTYGSSYGTTNTNSLGSTAPAAAGNYGVPYAAAGNYGTYSPITGMTY